MTSAASAADPSPASPVERDLALIASVAPLVPAWSVDRAFDYLVPGVLAASLAVGSLVRVPFGARRVRGLVLELRREVAGPGLQEILSSPLKAPVAPSPMPGLYEWLARRYAVPRARAFERAVPPRVRLEVQAGEALAERDGSGLVGGYRGGRELLAALGAGASGAWCLRALPTHSRSQIIGDLLSAASRRQGAALVAVPEVLHGARVLEELRGLFPSLVRVDSSTPELERAEGWMRMAGGHGLAGGGRAVVFAPAPRLSLIVLDEEHESVFKEDRSPRYDARRVALERSRLQGAICVFISATPSVERGGAAAMDQIGSVAPERDAERAVRPLVEVLPPPPGGGIGPELHARMRDVLRDGRSVALLAPATGYSRAIWCADCRRSLRCARCEAGLVFEQEQRRVRCRRCSFAGDVPVACPSCGGSELRHIGRGAERYAEQLAKSFPRVPLVHMDRVAAAGGPRDWSGHGIYVTTWFGTKPELRPEVSLVGVLDADALTRRVDFRAAEHAYQALAELSAWAGPASRGGRLVIQTEDPNHHATQAVVRADYGFFLTRELEFRRELSYPPFTELIKLSARGPAGGDLLDEAIARAREKGAKILGPIEAPFPSGGRDQRGKTEPGFQALLKCLSAQTVAEGLRDILPRVPRGTRLRVDVDPR
jgi:primosomal protein N'